MELDLVIKNGPASRYLEEAMFDRAQFHFEQGNYAASVSEIQQDYFGK